MLGAIIGDIVRSRFEWDISDAPEPYNWTIRYSNNSRFVYEVSNAYPETGMSY